tara:strand:- start:47 stop:823 length:777 start_codon:yes stop_codon:yes gene_type:complete
MYRNQLVTVVLPAFNEERLLPQTLAGLPQYVDRIIVVDDGSTDDTLLITRAIKDHRLKVLPHLMNQGVGRAISTGYREALSEDTDLIVVMGADNQMKPEEIPSLLDPIVDDESDYTKGNRLGHPDHKRLMPFVRRFGTWTLSYLTSMATGLSGIQDSQCGFTAISATTLRALPFETLYARYGYPNDLLSLLALRKKRVKDVIVTPIYQSEESNLHIHRVCLPLLGILIRALVRRLASAGRNHDNPIESPQIRRSSHSS